MFWDSLKEILTDWDYLLDGLIAIFWTIVISSPLIIWLCYLWERSDN